MDDIAQRHSDIATVIDIGFTFKGRPMKALKVVIVLSDVSA